MLLALVLTTALAVPAHTGYVTDTASILSTAEREQLNATLLAYRDRTTNEFAVLIIPSLQGEDLDGYANRVFHTWGIGRKGIDNGVLLLWSTGDRKVRLEVGTGLEPVLPDGRAGQIIREQILPRFRRQQWAAGLSDGVSAVIAQLDQTRPSGTPPVERDRGDGFWIVLIIGGILVLTIGTWAVAFLITRRRRAAEEEAERAHFMAITREPQRRPTWNSTPIAPRVQRLPIREPDTVRRSHTPTYEPAPYVAPSPDPPSPPADTSSYSGGDSGGGGASGSY